MFAAQVTDHAQVEPRVLNQREVDQGVARLTRNSIEVCIHLRRIPLQGVLIASTCWYTGERVGERSIARGGVGGLGGHVEFGKHVHLHGVRNPRSTSVEVGHTKSDTGRVRKRTWVVQRQIV